MMSLFTLTLILFLIMDPLGNMHFFINHVEGIKPSRQKFIIVREMLFALLAMIFFSILGDALIDLLSISQSTVYLASGIILLLTALRILFSSEERYPKKSDEEPYLVPLAIPIIAGPSLLATIMLFSDTEPSISKMLTAIFIAWACSAVLLISSKHVVRVLTKSGLTACERLMGMVLVLLSIQRIAEGVVLFMQPHQIS